MDEHDQRKQAIEDEMIRAAEDHEEENKTALPQKNSAEHIMNSTHC